MAETPIDRRRSLIDRLRGFYRIPITDGLGAVGAGDEPDNPNEYVRSFQVPPDRAPIQEEAAVEIGRLRAVIRVNWLRLGASDAELDKALYGDG